MLPLELGLRFERLEQRLLEEVRQRITNGELTERGLAKRIEVSQPHIHNILKGVRGLSPAIADLILEELGLNVLDLVKTEELWSALSMRVPREGEFTHVAVASGKLSPYSQFPDLGDADHWITLSVDLLRGARRPVVVEVMPDHALLGSFPQAEVAILDVDESQRLNPEPGEWYVVRLDGAGWIRQVRREGDELVLLGQQCTFQVDASPAIDLRGGTILTFVRAKVVWMGPDPRRSQPGSRPDASS
jgi:plasmid maintenance system antidote protein VapI